MNVRLLSFVIGAFLLLAPSAQAANPTIVCRLSASDKLIEKGETVTISWASINSLVSFGPGNTKIAGSGKMEVAPTETTIYKFKFVGIGGNERCGVRIRVIGDEPAP